MPELVARHHAAVRAMIARYHGVEIDTAGDGFFAAFDGPARGVRCAQQIIDAVGLSVWRFARASTPARCRRSMARPAGSGW